MGKFPGGRADYYFQKLQVAVSNVRYGCSLLLNGIAAGGKQFFTLRLTPTQS